MKKMTTIWMMIVMLGISIPVMGAMSISKMRQAHGSLPIR